MTEHLVILLNTSIFYSLIIFAQDKVSRCMGGRRLGLMLPVID
jgi:hypothetical protein